MRMPCGRLGDQVFIGKTNGSSCKKSRPKPLIQPHSSTNALCSSLLQRADFSCIQTGDNYNETHLTGLLLCKYTHIFFSGYGNTTLQELFPRFPEVQLFDTTISDMDIDQTMLLTTCLQQYWRKIYWCDIETAVSAVIALIWRMGGFLIYKITNNSEEVSSNLEQNANNASLSYPKKKTVRSFLCIILVMIRSIGMRAVTKNVANRCIQKDEGDAYLQVQGYSEAMQARMHICNPVHENILRIKRVRSGAGSSTGKNILQDEALWNYVRSKLPDNAIGEPPRRFSKEMNNLLRNCCILLQASCTHFQRNVALHECASVLQAALCTYYIVPAMDSYKKLIMLSDVLGGQRINYAFDYVNFDSGDIAQVLYLHNPLYKQGKAPSTVQEWDSGPCGPLSAFMAFDPTVEMYYEDEEDPLGILGLPCRVTRPSEHTKLKKTARGSVTELKRFAFIINNTGLFLLDRKESNVYTAEPSIDTPHHYALYLVCMYVFLNDQLSDIVKVAVNSMKISGNNNLQREI